MQNSQNKGGKSDVPSHQSVSSAVEGPPDLMNVFKTLMDRSVDNSVEKNPMYNEGLGKTPLREQLIQA